MSRPDIARNLALGSSLLLALGLSNAALGVEPRPSPVSEPVRKAVERQNDFTRAMVEAAVGSSPQDNLIVAPLGVAEVLDLIRGTAAGATAEELANLLGPKGSRDPLRSVDPSRPTIRPRLQAVLSNNDGYGVKLMGLPEEAPEFRAGLRPGDLILTFQGRPVRSRIRLEEAVARSEPGKPVVLQVYSYDSGLVAQPKLVLNTETAVMPGLSIVRGLWVQAGIQLADPLRASARTAHGLALLEADFKGRPDAARAAINAWLSRESGGGAIDPSDVEPDTRLLFVERLLLRASWVRPFPEARSGEFRTLEGAKVAMPLMRQEAVLPYVERKDFRMLELPLDDGRRSFLVILPGAIDGGFPAAGALAEALAALKPVLVDVILPRFTLETSRRLETDLAALGVKRAFSDEAELPGLGASEPLKLGVLRQSVRLDVMETGVKAQALTIASAVAIRGDRTAPLAFHADRPFLLLVVDRTTGLIVLAGRKVR